MKPLDDYQDGNLEEDPDNFFSASVDMTCDIGTLAAGDTRIFYVEVRNLFYPEDLILTATIASGDLSESGSSVALEVVYWDTDSCACRL